MATNTKTPIKSWKKFQLSLFSKGMLYVMSSSLHLVSFILYLVFLAPYISPFGYNNLAFWQAFYGLYSLIAIGLVWHGLRTLRKFFNSLKYDEEVRGVERIGYETERIDRT